MIRLARTNDGEFSSTPNEYELSLVSKWLSTSSAMIFRCWKAEEREDENRKREELEIADLRWVRLKEIQWPFVGLQKWNSSFSFSPTTYQWRAPRSPGSNRRTRLDCCPERPDEFSARSPWWFCIFSTSLQLFGGCWAVHFSLEVNWERRTG